MLIADAYGGRNDLESLADINARTGCVGCNLVEKDQALDRLLTLPQWTHLAPLKRLRPLYAELQQHKNRIRKDGTETRKDGSLVKNPGRVGPLKMEARKYGLRAVLNIQDEVNASARQSGRPEISLIDEEELSRIVDLIRLDTWPNGWNGDEISGDEYVPDVYRDGSVLADLFPQEDA